LARQAANPELTDAEVLQLHGCVWAAAETTFLAPDVLRAACEGTRELEDGEPVVLGFDGSERRDETWLVACSLDGVVQPLARWAKPKGASDDWRIPRGEVHRAVADAFDRFDVLEFAGDPPGWYAEFDVWADEYGAETVVEFETRQPKRMAPACERVRAGVLDGTVKFAGPLVGILLEHFGNCVAKDTPYGTAVTKDHPDSPRKIDGAVASIIAADRAMWHQTEGAQGVFVGSVSLGW
jgi:phage terminase large subunit-like protein